MRVNSRAEWPMAFGVNFPSNVFRNTRSFENWGRSPGCSSLARTAACPVMFRLFVRERK